MRSWLDAIRTPDTTASMPSRVGVSLLFVVLGFMLGIFQKWLDATPVNELPLIFQVLDIGNYFGRFAIWIVLATAISVAAKTPWAAAVHTFLFLISMVAGYYLYCSLVLGFLPWSYMMVWVALACASLPTSYVCWYAKGEGTPAIALSAVILGVLFSQAVLITQGIYMTHVTELITWAIGVAILARPPRELALMLALSLPVAVVYQLCIPYWG